MVTVPGFYSAYSGPVNSSSAWAMQMVAFRAAAPQPSDTIAPTVSVTPPTSGTGTITVTVSASDTGTGVAGVLLQVDGIPFGTAATASPYTFSLNTAKFSNGSHTLTASAFDFANNTATSSPVSVAFSNSSPGNPVQSGVWSGTVPLPIVSVNSVYLPSGKVLMWDGELSERLPSSGTLSTNTFDWVPAPTDIFCTANEQMADGRILVVGGVVTDHVGLPAANLFDASTESWTALPDMTYARWYPTATILPDGRVIVTSGEQTGVATDALVEEIYDPSTNTWSPLSKAPFPYDYDYPHNFLLPDGRILAAAASEWSIVSQVLDLNASTWTAVGGSTALNGGSSAMYLPYKILKTGHYDNPNVTQTPIGCHGLRPRHESDFPCMAPSGLDGISRGPTTTPLFSRTAPCWSPAAAHNHRREMSHDAVLPAELWSPTTETWKTLASMSAPRLYHSEGLLLPDGRVLISGGGRFNDDTEPVYQYSAEFFSPPYLFKNSGERPTITSAPSQLSYGKNFTVATPNAAQIAMVSLIRFGSVTHSINMSQRFLRLSFTAGSGSLSIVAPANANLAPPGNYMLFIVDTTGVPSVAAAVHF